MAGLRGPPEHFAGSHGRQQTHPGNGGLADHGGRAGDALKGHREGPGPRPMSNCCMSAGEVDAPATLGLEDGHHHGGETKPPKVVRMLAFMLRFLFNTPLGRRTGICGRMVLQQNGAGKEGGVLVPRADPRGGVPLGIQEWDPKRRIAALEMLGTLFLCNMILTHQGPLSSRVRLPAGSDNQGNVMAMLNPRSPTPRRS